jgi:hypothetical protein
MLDWEKELLEKFRKMSQWMCNDISLSMFCAKANFLVAMGLMNYTEIVGSFTVSKYQKDASGKIMKNNKGEPINTSSKERFNAFFRRLGCSYKELIDTEKLEVYDELRCGLTHEYLIKKKQFCIYGSAKILNEQEMDSLKNPVSPQSIAKCGVIHHVDGRGIETWHILTPKYYIDFQRAIKELISEIESEKDKTLSSNFFERCRYINLAHFF